MDYKHETAYLFDAESQTFNELVEQPVNLFADIKAFHDRFALTYDGPPRILEDGLAQFRVGFMGEELGEYAFGTSTEVDIFNTRRLITMLKDNTAPQTVPLDKQFDALIDLVYVALGTAYLQGFDFNEGWRRVHEANMRKVRALRESDSARGRTYDVVKPPGFIPADLSDLVK